MSGQSTGPGQPVIYGRRSSHYTRLALIAAHELAIEYSFVPVYDLMSLDAAQYGFHPGLRLPTLHLDGEVSFGSVNICRRLAESASRQNEIAWPGQHAGDTFPSNFEEITMQAMASQVSLILTTQIAKMEPDDIFPKKLLAGMCGMLEWLDSNIDDYLSRLPADRLFSVTEAALFCLVEHLTFRSTVPIDSYPKLAVFAAGFGSRASARETQYRIDSR